MKIRTFKNYFLVYYFIFLIFFSYTIFPSVCYDNLELLEPDNPRKEKEGESHNSESVLNHEIQTSNSDKEIYSPAEYDNEAAQGINHSSSEENITIDPEKENYKQNSTIINDIQTDNINLKSEDNTWLEEENSKEDNVDPIIDNNEDSDNLYRDDGVIEEENEEIFKDIESVVDMHEDPLSTSTTDTDWERKISDFVPAEMLTIELQSEKEVN